MAIKIKRTGYCIGCPCADVDVQTWWVDGCRDPDISCKYENVCEMWAGRIPRPKAGITDAEIDFVKNNPKLSKAFAAGWNACVKEMRKWEEN